MAVNLSRNTKVYFTTVAGASGYTTSNTFEIQVLDGYSFSQGTEQQTIQINEAGATPNRGQRAFNTQLNPVEWSFGAYIRPTLATTVTAVEKHIWNAIAGSQALVAPAQYLATVAVTGVTRSSTAAGATITVDTTLSHGLSVGDVVNLTGASDTTGFNGEYTVTGVTDVDTFTVISNETSTGTTPAGGTVVVAPCAWYENATFARTSFLGSNKHQLATFALIFKVDGTYYKIANCAVNQAEVSFDISGISQISWSGFGTTVAEIPAGVGKNELDALTPLVNNADFITNKLSTVTFESNIEGGGTVYSVPITGGTLTINNNLEYITPEILGVVNQSIGYYTGSRAISGNLTAYLRTGTAGDTASLLNAILADSQTSTETKYKVQVEVGGLSNVPRVEFLMNGCQVQVPTIDIQDVISTTVNFTAQGYTVGGTTYDIEETNDLRVTYYGKAP